MQLMLLAAGWMLTMLAQASSPRLAFAGDPPIDVCGVAEGGPFEWYNYCDEPPSGYQGCGVCNYLCPNELLWVIDDDPTCHYVPWEEFCDDLWEEVCAQPEVEWFALYEDFRDVLDWAAY